MGKAYVSYDEVRFLIQPDFTEVYILCNVFGDAPMQAQGWGYKVFPKTTSMMDIVTAWANDPKFEDPMLWPKKAPPTVSPRNPPKDL